MRRIVLGTGVCALALAVTAFADQDTWRMNATKHQTTGSTTDAMGFAKDAGFGYISSKLSGWLSRTDLDVDVREGYKPVGSVETIQPLFMDARHTVFWQGRAGYSDASTTANLGLGYRYLTLNKNWLLGANAFYDYDFRFIYRRIGLGAEVFTPYVTLRGNYYNAISHQTYIAVDSYARPLGGYDVSLETPMPYLPWMRFVIGGYHWGGVDAASTDGGLMNVRMFPYSQLEVDAGIAYDNNKYSQGFLSANLYLEKPVFIEHSASNEPRYLSQQRFAKQDLENMRLQKVIRQNDIVVEKTSTPGLTISRGN